jgi:glycerophosphoryl diester phosphodiesterase
MAIDPRTGVPLNGSFATLLTGGSGKGVSYDNIAIDSNGNVLIEEDETADGGGVMQAEGRNAGVWRYNIAKNEGVVGSDRLDFLFELDQKAAGAVFDTEAGAWESSGLIEVGSQKGQSSYLFNVMASTIDPNDDELPLEIRQQAAAVLGGNYAVGGQLILSISAPVIDLSNIGNDDDDDDGQSRQSQGDTPTSS